MELSRHVEEIVQACGAPQTRGGDSSLVQVCGDQLIVLIRWGRRLHSGAKCKEFTANCGNAV